MFCEKKLQKSYSLPQNDGILKKKLYMPLHQYIDINNLTCKLFPGQVKNEFLVYYMSLYSGKWNFIFAYANQFLGQAG